MKEFFRTMLDHFQNIKRRRQALLSITFTSMLSCYFPAIVFVHLHFIKEEGSIYYMHDSELKTEFLLCLSELFTMVLELLELQQPVHLVPFIALKNSCIWHVCTARFHTENREDKENCFNLFTWFNFFPVISWLPLLNWNSKTIIMREFYILTAYIFIVLEND